MIYASDKPPLTHNRYEQCWEFMFVLSKGKPTAFNPLMEKTINSGKRANSRTFMQKSSDGNYTPAHKSEPVAATAYRRNIWLFNQSYDGKHPAPFPEALARDHILSWSNEGDIVLDPFAGSFTTCKMARLMWRRWVGIEVNPEYCEIGKRRMAQQVFDFSS